MSKSCPGLLRQQALKEAKSTLAYGVGECRHDACVASPGKILQAGDVEALTLRTAVDLLIEGHVLKALDVAVQRVKSLEMMSKDTAAETACRAEVLKDRGALYSQAEASSALNESRGFAAKEKGTANLNWEKGSWKGGKGKDAKGKEQKGKEGKGALRSQVVRPNLA